MTITAHALRGGSNSFQETADGMSLLQYLMFSPGVPLLGTIVNGEPDTGYFAVQAQSSPNKTVKVKAGYMLVKATPTSEAERMFIVNLSADANVTIADNTTGADRFDKVYLYLPPADLHDPAVTGDLTEAACLLTERHTAANEALTATNAIELAEITVANGFTSIANTAILDSRVFSNLLSNSDWKNIVGAVTCGTENVLTISGTDYVYSVAVGDKVWVKDDGADWMGYVTAKDATTATIIGGTTAGAAGVIAANSKITCARYSKAENPSGHPIWFTWAPTIGASESMTFNGTAVVAMYRLIGREVEAYFNSSSGTTGGTASFGITVTPPVALSVPFLTGSVYTNGSAQAAGTIVWTTADKAYFRTTNGANWGLGASRTVAGIIRGLI